VPSRFLDELPEDHVEVKEAAGGTGGFGMSGYGASRFDEMSAFGSGYSTPGWQRAQARKGKGGFYDNGQPRYVPDGVYDDDSAPMDSDHFSPEGRGRARTVRAGEGERAPHYREGGAPSPRPSSRRGEGARGRRTALTIEGELIAKSTGTVSSFTVGERVFHLKFGNGNVVAVDGNKLTIRFDKAGEKRVVDSFVERL